MSNHKRTLEESTAESAVAVDDGIELEIQVAKEAPVQRSVAVDCEVCQSNPAKYTCPGCQLRTCSLVCVKKHKEERGCNGKRQRTAFVDIKKFEDKHVHSDMRFLEEVGREADNAKRGIKSVGKDMNGRNSASRNSKSAFDRLPPRIKELVREAEKRGTTLLLMPMGMSRHNDNTTYFERKEKKLLWRVEWLCKGVRVIDERVGEDNLLQDVYAEALKRAENTIEWPKRPELEIELSNQPVGAPKFKPVQPDMTFKDALAGCTIVEFPTVNVRLPEAE